MDFHKNFSLSFPFALIELKKTFMSALCSRARHNTSAANKGFVEFWIFTVFPAAGRKLVDFILFRGVDELALLFHQRWLCEKLRKFKFATDWNNSNRNSLIHHPQEHIRQSRESKLDEIERHSTKMTKSRENIAMHQLTKLPPPAFDLDPMTPINGGNNNTTNNSHMFGDEKEHSGSVHEDKMRKSESRNDLNMREQEIKHIFGSSYHRDDSSEYKDNSEMCDTACQTRYGSTSEVVSLLSFFVYLLSIIMRRREESCEFYSIIHSCQSEKRNRNFSAIAA